MRRPLKASRASKPNPAWSHVPQLQLRANQTVGGRKMCNITAGTDFITVVIKPIQPCSQRELDKAAQRFARWLRGADERKMCSHVGGNKLIVHRPGNLTLDTSSINQAVAQLRNFLQLECEFLK